MKTIFKSLLLLTIIFTLVACSAKSTEDIMDSPPTLLPNPFIERTSSGEASEENAQNQAMSFGFSSAPIAGFENCAQANSDCYINFDGRTIDLTFEFGEPGMKEIEIGLAIFIDGAIQPHQVVKSTQSSEGLRPIDELQYVSPHRIKTNETIEVTIRFLPVTGKKGETLSFNQMVMPYPSFMPDSPDQYFGIYQDAHPYDYGTIRFLEDAPSQIESPVVQVESQAIPESMKMVSDNNPTGRVQNPFYYFNDGSADYISKLILKDGKANLRVQIGGGVEADFRITIFINHVPVMVDGNESFIIKTMYDQIVTYNFELDVQGLPRFNSLYATILPTGDGYILNPESGFKTDSILLINEDAPWSGTASPTSISGQNTTDPGDKIESYFSQDGLQDLSSDLINNQISSGDILHLSSMSETSVLLVLNDMQVLIDTNSGEILKKISSNFDNSRSLVHFYQLEDGIAILGTDVIDNKTLICLYDSELQETECFDPASSFGIKQIFSEICAISETAEKIACLDNNFRSIFVGDIESKTRLNNIDLSKEFGNMDFRISALAFGGHDKYLAFVGFDDNQAYSHKTSYGIIDLDQNRVMSSGSKNNLNEFLIQSTSSNILFVERRNVFDMSDGNVLLYDLKTQEKKFIPFPQILSEWYRESYTLIISPEGQYLAGINHLGSGVDGSITKLVIRVYDSKTQAVLKEISLEGQFTDLPKVSFTSSEDSVLIAISEASNNRQIRLLKYSLP